MTTKTKKPPQEIPFSNIERNFTLASYTLGSRYCPAVASEERPLGKVYVIRAQVGATEHRNGDITRKYDYFTLLGDGEVVSAPRGWTPVYRGRRITGLAEAVLKYARCGECDTRGALFVGHGTCRGCSGYPGIEHEPTCGLEPCPNGCWDRINQPTTDAAKAESEAGR